MYAPNDHIKDIAFADPFATWAHHLAFDPVRFTQRCLQPFEFFPEARARVVIAVEDGPNTTLWVLEYTWVPATPDKP